MKFIWIISIEKPKTVAGKDSGVTYLISNLRLWMCIAWHLGEIVFIDFQILFASPWPCPTVLLTSTQYMYYTRSFSLPSQDFCYFEKQHTYLYDVFKRCPLEITVLYLHVYLPKARSMRGLGHVRGNKDFFKVGPV